MSSSAEEKESEPNQLKWFQTTWLWCSSHIRVNFFFNYGSLNLSKCINCMHFNLFYYQLHSLRISDMAANMKQNFNPIKISAWFYTYICLTCTTYLRLFILHKFEREKKFSIVAQKCIRPSCISFALIYSKKYLVFFFSLTCNNLFFDMEINWRKRLRAN